MGLGHLRAAYPLRDLADKGIIFYGSRSSTPPAEQRIWNKMRRIYYFSLRAERVPLVRQFLLKLLLFFERIRPYYPRKDLSRPNNAARYLNRLIRKRGVCAALAERVRSRSLPAINTFYATAIALDYLDAVEKEVVPRAVTETGVGDSGRLCSNDLGEPSVRAGLMSRIRVKT